MTGKKAIIKVWVCLIGAVAVVLIYLLFYPKSLLVHQLNPSLRVHMLPSTIELTQLNVQAVARVINNRAKGFTLKPPTMKSTGINTEDVHAFNVTQTINSLMESSNVTAPSSYIISLAPKLQLEFASSCTEKQRWLPKLCSFPEKELPEFLPNYKSPCWFNKTHHLRCLPYFLLAGFPKAGTTDLYDMLLVHPDFRPYIKEPHWIARERLCRTKKTNFDRYTNDIAAPLSALLEAEDDGNRTLNGSKRDTIKSPRRHRWYHNLLLSNLVKYSVTGDCSASTLWDNFDWQLAKENTLPLEPTMTNADYIHHLNNKTKTIVILRNPITRLYSEYLYFDHTHTRGAAEFHDTVVKGVQLFYECLEHYSLRHCVYSRRLNSQIKGIRLYIGIYFIHLLDWLRVFPRDQIFVVQLEKYTNHRKETIQKIYIFLQLRNITKLPEAEKFKKRAKRPVASNANKHGAYKNQTMFEETRTILYQFYKPFNRALAQLLNDSRFDYGPF